MTCYAPINSKKAANGGEWYVGDTLVRVLHIAPGFGLLAIYLGSYPPWGPYFFHIYLYIAPRVPSPLLKGPPQSTPAIPANIHDKQVRVGFWSTLA